jgi:hypothetical protein
MQKWRSASHAQGLVLTTMMMTAGLWVPLCPGKAIQLKTMVAPMAARPAMVAAGSGTEYNGGGGHWWMVAVLKAAIVAAVKAVKAVTTATVVMAATTFSPIVVICIFLRVGQLYGQRAPSAPPQAPSSAPPPRRQRWHLPLRQRLGVIGARTSGCC